MWLVLMKSLKNPTLPKLNGNSFYPSLERAAQVFPIQIVKSSSINLDTNLFCSLTY